MTPKTVRVAVTQPEPAWLDLGASVEKTCRYIEEAARNEAELIAFPECFVPGYPCWIWYGKFHIPDHTNCSYHVAGTGFLENAKMNADY